MPGIKSSHVPSRLSVCLSSKASFLGGINRRRVKRFYLFCTVSAASVQCAPFRRVQGEVEASERFRQAGNEGAHDVVNEARHKDAEEGDKAVQHKCLPFPEEGEILRGGGLRQWLSEQ